MVKVTIKGKGHMPQKALLPSAKEYYALLQKKTESYASNLVGSMRKGDKPKRGQIFHY